MNELKLSSDDAGTYPIAPNGIFRNVQGEGHLTGKLMIFVRLAGCSVGCPECDTDYRADRRLTVQQIVSEVEALGLPGVSDIWITGGEPANHDLLPLIRALRGAGIAVATSGAKELALGVWLSVSPHSPDTWKQRVGAELKLVSGLNGVRLKDFEPILAERTTQFGHKFVQPLWDARIDAPDRRSLEECLVWLETHPGWRMSFQGHKQMRLA